MTPSRPTLVRPLTPISGGSGARDDTHRHLALAPSGGADPSVTAPQYGPGEIALYQALAFHPGQDFTIESLTAGLAWPDTQVERAVRALLRERCFEPAVPGRYRIGTVLHAIRRKVLAQESSTVDWTAQAQRMITWYLCQATAVTELVRTANVHDDSIPRDADHVVFASRQAKLTWFAVECANAVDAQRIAAEHRWDELTITLGEALWQPLQYHSDAINESITVQRTAADAARRVADGYREALCRLREGVALAQAQSFSDGMRACLRAYHCATHSGRPELQAAALLARSQVQLEASEPGTATADALSAQTIARHCSDRRTHALCYMHLGRCALHPRACDIDGAIDSLTAAVNALTVLDEHREHARARMLLAEAHLQHGDPTAATRVLRPAWSLLRSVGWPADLAAASALRNKLPTCSEHLVRPTDATRAEPMSVRPHRVTPLRDHAWEGNP